MYVEIDDLPRMEREAWSRGDAATAAALAVAMDSAEDAEQERAALVQELEQEQAAHERTKDEMQELERTMARLVGDLLDALDGARRIGNRAAVMAAVRALQAELDIH